MIKRRIYKICPYWKRHVMATWNFQEIKDFHWWCKKCPMKQMNGVGRAYRRTIDKKNEK